MRVIALINWYEENPAWLSETVASTAKLCDHVIAVDGPYAHFPGALKKPYSGTEQADAILRTAAGVGMGCTIHSPRQPWWDGEVGKRDFMFQLGMTFAQEGDWFLRIDADEVLTDVPLSTREMLEGTDKSVAEIMLWERESGGGVGEGGDSQYPFRCLFRAVPGIRIEQAHYVVTAPIDGKREFLNGGPKNAPAESLWDVRLEHRTHQRTANRKQLKNTYSPMINDLEGVENEPRPE